jgi:lycopene beta-cyclase
MAMSSVKPPHYDYIFLWWWVSVFMLLLHFAERQDFFLTKTILIILWTNDDTSNYTPDDDYVVQDKRLSFWSEKFPEILLWLAHTTRNTSRIVTHNGSRSTKLHTIPYRSVSSHDLLGFIADKLSRSQLSITYVHETVTALWVTQSWSFCNLHTVTTSHQTYYGTSVFNSIVSFCNVPAQDTMFWQCFVWFDVSYDQAVFSPDEASIMEFPIEQDTINFIYTLPSSSHRALVEYTYFLPQQRSYKAIEEKLVTHLSALWNYHVHTRERGCIPMYHTAYRWSSTFIDIGTAWGATKPSSGYTFINILKHSQSITNALIAGISPPKAYCSRHRWYDAIMLQVMSDCPSLYHSLMYRLFHKSPERHLIRFLNEESTLLEEFSIVRSLPKLLFIKAFIRYSLWWNALCKRLLAVLWAILGKGI